ncbi:MAG TPA: 2-C-methyl-D-erythritol 2,4-cyclodiphosphate synthase [Candidatus Syntrophosphaera sp.]|jgi:2-C-methyl-D-erythritol 2,4-cyclodiphosphate synthase|nr:2-C-methyl-D-erythritol 2,4-cyclodiphosphate synthase [Candidatus Syntrophosphaera sp.]HOH48175.1 2-C-methyl-D-erythritol 2,4-cyclodiphosphate synthase [Candidatus Syntrophosphaera sp.]HPB42893.1 2-C-methyl-D-erythritol 2,4-cyclodiphosphate synthase [Candidatus Syntrophosphaera sp.]HPW38553.1 2-C-methyl-D-erythritol 2,4-cyclodiphosphate synthase [Candidatus Syntrophosphaera sp.]HQC46934.1 2-C-methyl-D-erythritol 2,4-cyclodiphosphate synthase [Candidatus Syntrophosphaera sp.]
MFRVGQGYDVHTMAPGRKLILGGVRIPFHLGLLGHSDADVLVHAVIDALLGALALGDIGSHFPDTDPAFAGADSRDLLRRVFAMVRERGWALTNLDCTVCAERPKLSPYIEDIRDNLALDLNTSRDNVSVKATTEEGLGVSGGGAGMAAHCTLLLKRS